MSSMRRGHNKKIALLIAVMALFLAFSETLGKSAQTAAHQRQRRGVESVGVLPGQDHPHDDGAHRRGRPARSTPTSRPIRRSRRRMAKQIDAWQRTAARYESTSRRRSEGRKQLRARAKEAEHKRDLALAQLPPLRGRVGRVPDRHRAGSAAVITGMIGAGLGRRRARRRSASASWGSACSRRTPCICSDARVAAVMRRCRAVARGGGCAQ